MLFRLHIKKETAKADSSTTVHYNNDVDLSWNVNAPWHTQSNAAYGVETIQKMDNNIYEDISDEYIKGNLASSVSKLEKQYAKGSKHINCTYSNVNPKSNDFGQDSTKPFGLHKEYSNNCSVNNGDPHKDVQAVYDNYCYKSDDLVTSQASSNRKESNGNQDYAKRKQQLNADDEYYSEVPADVHTNNSSNDPLYYSQVPTEVCRDDNQKNKSKADWSLKALNTNKENVFPDYAKSKNVIRAPVISDVYYSEVPHEISMDTTDNEDYYSQVPNELYADGQTACNVYYSEVPSEECQTGESIDNFYYSEPPSDIYSDINLVEPKESPDAVSTDNDLGRESFTIMQSDANYDSTSPNNQRNTRVSDYNILPVACTDGNYDVTENQNSPFRMIDDIYSTVNDDSIC